MTDSRRPASALRQWRIWGRGAGALVATILTVTAEERGTRRTVSATFSTQDTAETVKRRMAGAHGAEPERLDAPEPRGGKSGWMSRLFGRRVS